METVDRAASVFATWLSGRMLLQVGVVLVEDGLCAMSYDVRIQQRVSKGTIVRESYRPTTHSARAAFESGYIACVV